MERPNFFTLKNGEKAKLPFTDQEYQSRLTKLRTTMSKNNLDMIILTSMHNIAYYTGFIYCSFGRPYGCIVTANKISTISANIDASQPWRRSHCDNVIYTDWKRDNFLKAIVSIIGRDEPPKSIGIENDHVTIDIKEKLNSIFTFSTFSDVSQDLMKLRMIKSKEEIEVIKNGARIADLGGKEIVKNTKPLITQRGQTIELHIHDDCLINGEQHKIERVIQNLIDNASQYGSAHGLISVSLDKVCDTIRLVVSNDGDIIPQSEKIKVFDPYYRILGSKSFGSGLGLAIVKEKSGHLTHPLEENVVLYIASSITGSIRELEGVLNIINMHAEVKQKPISPDLFIDKDKKPKRSNCHW